MNKQQFATLAIGIKSAYPASKILEDKASMDFWYMTLKDIPYEIAENAVIANTITNPLTGHVLFPNEKEGQELWYMPMFQNQIWTWRRLFQSMGGLGGTATTEKTVEKEHFYMFFDFDKKEEAYGNR